jgi:hypothetical protein
MLLSLVTGWGHIYLRHYVLGAILFCLFATALNGVFLGSVIESDKSLARFIFDASVPAAGAIWLFGLVHAWKISYGCDRVKLRAERTRLFRDGLTAYLRDDLDTAARALESCVDRDVDWEDSDALFHLGVVEMRRAEVFGGRGERRAAERAQSRGLRAFKVCLAHDDRKKWRGEIAHEQARAKQKPVRLPRPTRRIGTDSSSEHPSSLNLMRPASSGRVPIPKDIAQQEKAP